LRDGRAPLHGDAVSLAADVAYGMTIRNVEGCVVRDVDELTLSDFLPQAANARGPLGCLVLDAARAARPSLVEALREMCGHPPQTPSPAPKRHAAASAPYSAPAHGNGRSGAGGMHVSRGASPPPSTPTAAGVAAAESPTDPLVALQARAASAARELAAVEECCGDLLDSTHRRHAGTRQLLAACQAAGAAFHRTLAAPAPSTPAAAPAPSAAAHSSGFSGHGSSGSGWGGNNGGRTGPVRAPYGAAASTAASRARTPVAVAAAAAAAAAAASTPVVRPARRSTPAAGPTREPSPAANRRSPPPPTPASAEAMPPPPPQAPHASRAPPHGYAEARAAWEPDDAAASAAAAGHSTAAGDSANLPGPPGLSGSSSPPPPFAVGEFLQYRRANGMARTVTVVEVLDGRPITYGVEYEVVTTAHHVTLAPGQPEGAPIVKHSEVMYKLDNAARVVDANVANQEYVLAVKVYTDASRLSRQ